jgi:hypothetical protein
MKALTICQPYATMIMQPYDGESIKRVENREWPTSYRGPLIIHAGKSREWCGSEKDESLPRGVILGVVDLIDCVRVPEYLDKYDANGEHAHGSWCWVLRNPQAIRDPIPYKGQLGLFEISDEILKQAGVL